MRQCKADQPHEAQSCKECGEELELESAGLCVMPDSHHSPGLLEMIYRIGTCLTKTMDLDHFLGVVTEELANRMELEAVGILLHDERSNDFSWREIRDPECLLREDTSKRLGAIGPNCN